jgi:hypothetical protein
MMRSDSWRKVESMVRGRVGASLGLSLVAFIGAGILLPRPYLFDITNGMGIAFAVAVVFRYWRGLVDFFRSLWFVAPLKPGHLLIASTVLILLAFCGRTIWIEVWREIGTPDGGLDHILFAFLAYLFIPGCILALAGPRLWRATHFHPEGPTLPLTIVGGVLLSAAFALWRYLDMIN